MNKIFRNFVSKVLKNKKCCSNLSLQHTVYYDKSMPTIAIAHWSACTTGHRCNFFGRTRRPDFFPLFSSRLFVRREKTKLRSFWFCLPVCLPSPGAGEPGAYNKRALYSNKTSFHSPPPPFPYEFRHPCSLPSLRPPPLLQEPVPPQCAETFNVPPFFDFRGIFLPFCLRQRLRRKIKGNTRVFKTCSTFVRCRSIYSPYLQGRKECARSWARKNLNDECPRKRGTGGRWRERTRKSNGATRL